MQTNIEVAPVIVSGKRRIAALLGVGSNMVPKLVRKRGLPAYKDGKIWKITYLKAVAWAKEQERFDDP